MNPVLLLVGAAHAALVAYWLLTRARTEPRAGLCVRGLGLGLAGVVAVLLVWPLLGYLGAVSRFYAAHRDYLIWFGPSNLMFWSIFVYKHNSTFLVAGLIGVVVAGLERARCKVREAARRAAAGVPAAKEAKVLAPPTEPSSQPSEATPGARGSRVLLWLGLCWLVLPQVAAVVLYYVNDQSTYLSRYYSYTPLGGICVLAYLAARMPSAGTQLTVTAALALATGLWGLRQDSRGTVLTTGTQPSAIARKLDELEDQGLLRPDDVLLFRSGFLEADFLPGAIPPANRDHIERLTTTPVTTLYVARTPRPIIPLSFSHYRSERDWTPLGPFYRQRRWFYGPELAAKLRPHDRFWFVSGNRPDFLACFLPWLADSLKSELRVSVIRPTTRVQFDVPVGLKPSDPIKGLHDRPAADFAYPILIERKSPRGASDP
jgi:hypothetical protein